MPTEAEQWEDLSLSPSPCPSPSISGSSTDRSPVGLSVAPSRRSSFSYYRLPDPHLRLSVLRLDRSSFQVKVARTATVLRLKMAVEDVFRDHSETARGGSGNISWSHVWGHFCLCYKDYKLLDDRKYLKEYRIKDGDQLHFIRHLSVNHDPNKGHNPIKRRSKHHEVVERNVMLLTGPEENNDNLKGNNSTIGFEFGDDRIDDIKGNDSAIGFEYGDDRIYDEEEDLLDKESKLTNSWRRWLSCSNIGSSRRTRSEERPRHRRAVTYF